MKTRPSVLVVGGDSQVGKYLVAMLKTREFDVVFTSRREQKLESPNLFFDLESDDDIEFTIPFDFAIICVGITSVSKCETDTSKSEQLNVIATTKLIDKLVELKVFIIYLSSNLVFSGKKAFYSIHDTPDPISNYGKFKLKIEKLLEKKAHNQFAVLRMTKVLPVDALNQFSWQLEISGGRSAELFTNVYLAPVGMEKVGETILAILRSSKSGIFQISAPREISYFDFGTKWAIDNHLNPELIVPTLSVNPIQSKHNSLVMHTPI
jgi:dTDP-4-dehydrorhamnose reductase